MENRPNFYAVIPAYVRYDKDLSSTAKLLYGEISSLCNEKGYCWATNDYFANLYSISERQVQRMIKSLSDKKYIRVVIDRNTKRKIYLLDTPDKNVIGGMTKMSHPPDDNVIHNNKNNNKVIVETNREGDAPLSYYDWLN